MRARRMLSLVMEVQRRRTATAAELASVLEVSVRTVYRDVSALQEAGIPLWTEAGPGGGIRLVEGWRTRLDGMTADEAGTLFLAGAPAAAAELGLGSVLAAAESKVFATLPDELRDRAGRIRQRFHLDAAGWFHRPDDVPRLAVVAAALWDDRQLEVTYAGAERRLHPLGLVLKAGRWYLVAAAGGTPRTWRVSRIESARPLDEACTRPAGFVLEHWWATSSGEFDRAVLRAQVELLLDAPAVRLLGHVVDPRAAAEALAAAGPPDGSGRVRVRLAVESAEVAHGQLLALGASFEVLAPEGLRRRLAATTAAMAARHAGPGGGPGDGPGGAPGPARSAAPGGVSAGPVG